ncbi:MAG: helix-turn-helix domain-containing protein [Opitutaceae bacterium]
MIISSIKELNDTKAKVARLEQALAKELASLPSAYGFESLKEFVAAIKAAGGGGKRAGRPKTRKRAKITDSIRAKVGKLVKAKQTGSQIAKALGISLPSVQNIKKALGLVRKFKKPARKPAISRTPAKLAAVPKLPKKHVSPKKAAAPESKASQVSDAATPVPST